MSLRNLIQKSKWPLYVAAVALLIPVVILAYQLLQKTGGAFSLPGDEAFLQLSTAKTLAFRHVWGIGRYNFAAATPSLLYPVVLAIVFFISGVHLILIPIINTIIAILLLAAIQKWLAQKAVKPTNQLLILLAVIVLTPLPLMVIYGMERTLLFLFAFLFLSRLADEWNLPEFSRRTLIYGALLMAAGYAGIILVAGIALLLIFQRKWLVAFELALWSLLPILVFGIMAMFKGSYFLPNVYMVGSASPLLTYDWLLGCGIAVTIPLLSPYTAKQVSRRKNWAVVSTALATVLILCTRDLFAFRDAARSSLRTYRMEYPIAQFAHRYYYWNGIVSDDMGIISYLTEGRYLDLSGLGSNKIARSKSDNYFNPALVQQLSRAQSLQVAIISDQYDKTLPESWIRAASWKISYHELSGTKTVFFYAMDSTLAAWLKKNLIEYTYFLPKDVTVHYFY